MNILAIIFPGQGSQRVGMLSKFSGNHILQETFNEASDILHYDLWHLIQCGPVEELNKTSRTQPAILAASVAIWRIWKSRGGKMPRFMAGHSLGEYSALVCADVIKFSSAIKLVELRGMLMQDIISQNFGLMSAILGLEENIIVSICRKVTSYGQIVSLSAFNAPNHVVISGYRRSVERVNIICKKLGANVFILPISIPSHCALMFPASKIFKKELKKVKFFKPCVSVINNVDVCIEDDINYIKQALVRQIYTPVHWRETIEYLMRSNTNVLVEIGPGRILSSMAKRIIGTNLLNISINDISSLNLAVKY